jgi:hypothetical protein
VRKLFFGSFWFYFWIWAIDKRGALIDERRMPTTPDFGVWIEGEEDSENGCYLAGW